METVFITGANRGIGLELTRQALAAGNRVAAGCRQPDAAADLQALTAQFGDTLLVLPLDVSKDDQVSAAAAAVAAQFSRVDLLINNAGVFPKGESLAQFDAKAMLHTFDVNVAGPMRVVSIFADLLRRSDHGRILNISSQLGALTKTESTWGGYSYNSSKAALNMITRMMAHELKGAGITAVAVHPGWAQTDMGGPNATLPAADSARGILQLAENLTPEQASQFFTYTGEPHPW
jgi:NAD(P)-dependent dehydrogenase (short-subunit alcohol dehydrogenase family)